MHPAPTKSRSEFPSTFVLGRFLTSIPRSAYSASRKTLRSTPQNTPLPYLTWNIPIYGINGYMNLNHHNFMLRLPT